MGYKITKLVYFVINIRGKLIHRWYIEAQYAYLGDNLGQVQGHNRSSQKSTLLYQSFA